MTYSIRTLTIVSLLLGGSLFVAPVPPAGANARAAAAIARCHTGHIYISSVGGQAAVGNVGRTFRFQSVTSQTCAVYGYPGVQMIRADGQLL
jgi:hypothetical protein